MPTYPQSHRNARLAAYQSFLRKFLAHQKTSSKAKETHFPLLLPRPISGAGLVLIERTTAKKDYNPKRNLESQISQKKLDRKTNEIKKAIINANRAIA